MTVSLEALELNSPFTARCASIIEKKISGSVHHLLAEADCWLAGGALTSLFTGKDVNDWDIYFSTQRGVDLVIANIYGHDDWLDKYELVATFATDRSLTTNLNRSAKELVQFIYYKTFKSPADIFSSFDYTVNMCAYSFKEKKFYAHPSFLTHASQRYLKFNPGTDFPLISVLRAAKYKEKGYTISKSEMIRAVMAVTMVNFDSWETAISHIGSMYGVAIDKMFDQTKEFSIVELIQQLENIDLDTVTTTPDQPTMLEVVEKCVACSPLMKQYAKDLEDYSTSKSWYDYMTQPATKKPKKPLLPESKKSDDDDDLKFF